MPAPSARRLRAPQADLDLLSSILEGDPDTSEGGYLDLDTGEAWPMSVLSDAEDVDLDEDRWYHVPCEGSRGAWQDVRDFIDDHVADPVLADRLGEAITGRGAFRRFSAIMREHDELRTAWLHLRDERARSRARQWLVDEGLVDR